MASDQRTAWRGGTHSALLEASMGFKLMLLMAALIGMAAATGPAHDHAAAHPDAEDPDAGYRAFGKVVSGFTILAALIVALVLVLMFLSVFGVFEKEAIDPPV